MSTVSETQAVADPDVRWLVVRKAERRERLDAYLYGSAIIVHELSAGYGDVFILVVTEVAGQDGRAEYLANYQAGRLQSGLMIATVHGSYASAYNEALDYATGVKG